MTDLDKRWAIAGLRGLGRAGLRVMVTAPRWSAPGLWSKYAAGRALAPWSLEDPDGFIQAVSRLVFRHEPAVVYPGTEESIDALMSNPAALGPTVRLPYAGLEPLRALRDKLRLRDAAVGAGLPVPTILAEGPAAELAQGNLPDEGVVKSVTAGRALETRMGGTADELRYALSRFPGDEPVLIQEVIEGALCSVEMVVDRQGAVVARFQQRVRRTWPSHGGHVVESVSVEPDEELIGRMASMLQSVGHWGLAHVQFLERGSRSYVIDVNPRFFGPLPLALASGVNLPAAWHAVATGRPAPQVPSYSVGVTYRRLDADLTAAMRGSPELLFRRSPAPRVGSFWASDDPVPSILLTGAALTARVSTRLAAAPGRGRS